MVNNEIIIQKCFGIATMAHERNRASLGQNEKKFAKYDAEINALIDKLVKMIKDET